MDDYCLWPNGDFCVNEPESLEEYLLYHSDDFMLITQNTTMGELITGVGKTVARNFLMEILE